LHLLGNGIKIILTGTDSEERVKGNCLLDMHKVFKEEFMQHRNEVKYDLRPDK